MQTYNFESKERQAADARKALGLPPLQTTFLGKIVDAFRGRGDPLRECGMYRDKGCCYVDGPMCDFPVCDMNQEHSDNQPNTEEAAAHNADLEEDTL